MKIDQLITDLDTPGHWTHTFGLFIDKLTNAPENAGDRAVKGDLYVYDFLNTKHGPVDVCHCKNEWYLRKPDTGEISQSFKTKTEAINAEINNNVEWGTNGTEL